MSPSVQRGPILGQMCKSCSGDCPRLALDNCGFSCQREKAIYIISCDYPNQTSIHIKKTMYDHLPDIPWTTLANRALTNVVDYGQADRYSQIAVTRAASSFRDQVGGRETEQY